MFQQGQKVRCVARDDEMAPGCAAVLEKDKVYTVDEHMSTEQCRGKNRVHFLRPEDGGLVRLVDGTEWYGRRFVAA